MQTGLQNVATRAESARARLVSTIAERGGISAEQAEAVAALYLSKKMGAAKLDVVGGQFTMTHGAYLNRDVIRRAVTMALATESR